MGHVDFLNVFDVMWFDVFYVIINFAFFSKAANDIGNFIHIFSVSFYVNLAALQRHTAFWQGGLTFPHGPKLLPRDQWEALAYAVRCRTRSLTSSSSCHYKVSKSCNHAITWLRKYLRVCANFGIMNTKQDQGPTRHWSMAHRSLNNSFCVLIQSWDSNETVMRQA